MGIRNAAEEKTMFLDRDCIPAKLCACALKRIVNQLMENPENTSLEGPYAYSMRALLADLRSERGNT